MNKKCIFLSILILLIITFMLSPLYILFINSLMNETDHVEKAPIAGSIEQSIHNTNNYSSSKFPIIMYQYKALFTSGDAYFVWLLRSWLIALIISFSQFMCSIPLGLLLGLFSFKGKRFIIGMIFVTAVFPYSVTLLPNYIIIRELQLLNTQLSIIIPSIYTPIHILIIFVYSKKINSEIVEAALIETNSWPIINRFIILPCMKPAIILTFLFSFFESWNMVEQPQAMMDDVLLHPLSASLNNIFNSVTNANFAASFIYMLPPVSLLLSFGKMLFSELDYERIIGATHVKD